MTQPNWTEFAEELASLGNQPQQWPTHCNAKRMQMWSLPQDDALAPSALQQLWQGANVEVRANWLAPVLSGQTLPAQFRQFLALRAPQGDTRSLDAALEVVGNGDDLTDAHWQALVRRCVRERDQVVPDSEAAVFVARHGSAQCFSTVALTAFRNGPEDADDRLVALGQLGRFAQAQSLPWLLAVANRGAAHLEVVQAASLAMGGGAAPAQWSRLLTAVGGCPRGLDALARWSALQALCHFIGPAAEPYVAAAAAAGGADLPDGYADGLRAQIAVLGVSHTRHSDLPVWPPLPDLRGQVHSRDARVARQSAVLWQQAQGDPAELSHRAGMEAALVARGQLLASLLPVTAASVELSADWRPICDILTAAERTELANFEADYVSEAA